MGVPRVMTELLEGELSVMFAGIDWGGYHHQLCIVGPVGQRMIERRFAHDRAGLIELRNTMAAHAPLPIAVERAEGLLVESLLDWGHEVFPVSPRISARARERYRVASSKDDMFDAFVLADSLRHEHLHWRPLVAPSADLAELKALVRDRVRIMGLQQVVEAQLRATLDTYHPAPAALFTSIDRQITLDFIRDYPNPRSAAHVAEARMDQFLSRHNYRGRQPASLLTDRLRVHLLEAAPGTTAARQRTALAQVEQLELFNRQLKDFTKTIDTVLRRHPDHQLFLSFPGVASTTAATLLAEIGEDRDRFPHPAHLLAEAGLAPVTRASGRSTRVRFRYAANNHLRDAFMWWAFTSIRVNPWARAGYEAAKARGQHHHRALRGTSARWGRVLWRCWQDGTPYDPMKHLSATN
jgi:transposase